MDEIDLKLLRLLQKNARTPIKALAGEVRLPPLRFPRVLSGWKNRVLFVRIRSIWTRCSLAITFSRTFIWICSPPRKRNFIRSFAACSNVLECNCVTGNYSMLIKVSFASTQELDGFIGRLQKFGKTETQIVFSSPVPPRAIVV